MAPSNLMAQKWFRWGLQLAAGFTVIFAVVQWELSSYRRCRSREAAHIDIPTNSIPNPVRDFSAGNSTLGFNAVLALSQGTEWRVNGLRAAAAISGIDLQIPPQPAWSEPFINAFQEFGPVEAHGAAMAWLAHIDLLKFVILNNWGSALIMEDDIDWSVDIRQQTRKIADAVRALTKQRKFAHPHAPYGLEWDVLWMGHCSDPPDASKPFIVFEDETAIPLDLYRGLNRHITTLLQENQRAVHHSINPVCTFAYAVSAKGARKVLHLASQGKGGAFDLMMMHACQKRTLDCISVNPEIFDPYHPAGGDESEVGSGDRTGQKFKSKITGAVMGHTDNILKSARCMAQFQTTCFQNGTGPH